MNYSVTSDVSLRPWLAMRSSIASDVSLGCGRQRQHNDNTTAHMKQQHQTHGRIRLNQTNRGCMKKKRQSLSAVILLAGLMFLPKASAQVTNVVFSDDFSGSLNTNNWIVGKRTLEGGTGTIVPTVSNGVVEITGTTTEQWWAGGSLQLATNFAANAETNVMFSV